MVEIWTDDVESIVFTKIKYSFPKSLKEKNTDLNFTAESTNGTPKQFPCVYVQRLPSAETAQSLDGIGIPAALFSFQITVIDNSSRSLAKRIMDEVVNIMSKMHFSMVQTPIAQSENSLYIEVARFRRMIADGDIL